ncbi:TPA: hypothetical protein ACG0BA_002245 [Serratia odorifera]
MPFSDNVVQKADEISDGKDTFKGGLSISISCENLGARLRGFLHFTDVALSTLFRGSKTIVFHDIGDDAWKRGMTRIENNRSERAYKS